MHSCVDNKIHVREHCKKKKIGSFHKDDKYTKEIEEISEKYYYLLDFQTRNCWLWLMAVDAQL